MMKSAIHFLGGSLAVYALMAACSAGTKNNAAGTMAASGAASQGTMVSGGTDGTGTPTSGSNGIGGIVGEMMDPVENADAATSGTRLRASYYVAEDGSKQFAGWHDTMRNENCSFVSGYDAVIRCLPVVAASSAGYFSDAGCATPLFVAGKAAGCTLTAAKYAWTTDAQSCSYVLSTLVAASPAMIYTGKPGTCTATPAPAIFSYFTGTGTVPLSAFVSATEQVE